MVVPRNSERLRRDELRRTEGSNQNIIRKAYCYGRYNSIIYFSNGGFLLFGLS